MSDNWFSTGFERAREEQEKQKKGEVDFGNNDRSRFFAQVGPDNVRQIIFLDDFTWKTNLGGHDTNVVPFCFHEYKIDLNNREESWRYPIYITASPTNCKPAELGFRRLFVGAFTILDITPFVDKQTGQKVVRPRKRLMMASSTAMSIIETKKNTKGNLCGWKYSVARHENTDPRVGSDFEPMEQYENVSEYLKATFGVSDLNLDPYGFNADDAMAYYRELFKPMEYSEQEQILKGPVQDGSLFRKGRAQGAVPAAGSGQSEPEASIQY